MSGSRRSGRLSMIPSDALDDVRMSPAALRVLMAIGSYADVKTGICYPRQQTIAARLGIARQAVSRQLAALVRLGYIELVEHRRGTNGQQLSSVYRVVLDFDLPSAYRRAAQPEVARTAQPQVDSRATWEARAAQPDVDSRATSDVALLTSGFNGTDDGTVSVDVGAPHAARDHHRDERTNGVIADELTPATADDIALWAVARAAMTAEYAPGVAADVALLEVLGRGADGGLRLRAPRGLYRPERFTAHAARALVDAGDAAGGHVQIAGG